MMFTGKLLLLRHGETEWNREGRIQGSKDSPLTELGVKQAERQREILADILPGFGEYRLYVSPLKRAMTTAAIALPEATPIIDQRLTEIACGLWEGLLPAERKIGWPGITANCTEDFDLYQYAPEGEGIDRLSVRVMDFLQSLSKPTIVVAHKVVLIALRGILLNLDQQGLRGLHAPQGVVIQAHGGKESVLQ